jgi:group I intron endonuclease
MAVIYKATNKINKKSYIGFAVDFEKRKNEHIKQMQYARTYFHRALIKYGLDNFEWTILKEDATLEDEIILIREHETFWTLEKGYNLTLGGEGLLGHIKTEETKEKLRKAHLGKKPTENQLKTLRENAKKMQEIGHTEETKKKISDSLKGKPLTEEHKKNISLNHASKKETGSYYQSEEYKEKMSKSLKGKKRTPEAIEKYRLAAKKRWAANRGLA